VTDLHERLSHVLWIGGGTGAGKSSVAMALAERHGLARYDYDWHDSRDHTERTRQDRHPHRAAFLAMSLDERWVLGTPREMADNAIGSFRERFEMVIEDLLAMPRDRWIVADGFGFLPELVAPVIASPHQAIWLLPTGTFRDFALTRRGWTTIEGTTNADRARANRLTRDDLLTEHVRQTAAKLGFATIDVDGARVLAEIIDEVERHFSPLLPTPA
jgi:adenylate kinase family enzyme